MNDGTKKKWWHRPENTSVTQIDADAGPDDSDAAFSDDHNCKSSTTLLSKVENVKTRKHSFFHTKQPFWITPQLMIIKYHHSQLFIVGWTDHRFELFCPTIEPVHKPLHSVSMDCAIADTAYHCAHQCAVHCELSLHQWWSQQHALHSSSNLLQEIKYSVFSLMHCIALGVLLHIWGLSFAGTRIKIPTIAVASLDASLWCTSELRCFKVLPL